MGQFVSRSKTLRGVLWAVERRVPLFGSLTKVKVYLLLRYFIKNLFTGVAYGPLLNLF